MMIEVSQDALRMDSHFDLLVVACGYEARSYYVPSLGLSAENRVAVRLAPTPGGQYGRNLALLEADKWRLDPPAGVPDVLRGVANAAQEEGRVASVGIDISSLPRSLLGTIVQTLAEYGQDIDARFLYCPAWFEDSKEQAARVSTLAAGPVSTYFAGAVRSSAIPIGLVVGLGLEPHRSEGVREFLEPSRVWPFVAEGMDARFVDEVLRVNTSILRSGAVQPLRYDIRDAATTYRSLCSLVGAAGHSYRLVLAPSGPKVFALACLLVGLDRNETRPSVWRVGPQSDPDVARDVEASGEVVSTLVRFRSSGAVR